MQKRYLSTLESLPKKVTEAVKRLKNGLEKKGIGAKAIYFFGSYAKENWLETSDIDLVVSDYWENILFLKRMDLINEVLWKEGIRKVEAILATEEEVRRNLLF